MSGGRRGFFRLSFFFFFLGEKVVRDLVCWLVGLFGSFCHSLVVWGGKAIDSGYHDEFHDLHAVLAEAGGRFGGSKKVGTWLRSFLEGFYLFGWFCLSFFF